MRSEEDCVSVVKVETEETNRDVGDGHNCLRGTRAGLCLLGHWHFGVLLTAVTAQ